MLAECSDLRLRNLLVRSLEPQEVIPAWFRALRACGGRLARRKKPACGLLLEIRAPGTPNLEGAVFRWLERSAPWHAALVGRKEDALLVLLAPCSAVSSGVLSVRGRRVEAGLAEALKSEGAAGSGPRTTKQHPAWRRSDDRPPQKG